MLASGGYIEGEAIVGLFDTGDDAEATLFGAEGNSLMTQAVSSEEAIESLTVEPLMQVGYSATDASAGGLAVQSRESVTLALVHVDGLTTREILNALVDDPRVAFAEPNYEGELFGDDAEDDGQATEGAAPDFTAANASDLRKL